MAMIADSARSHDLRRTEHPADAMHPEAVALGEARHGDDVGRELARARAEDAVLRKGVERRVDLVDEEIRAARLGDARELAQRRVRRANAGRVVQVRDDDDPRARRHRGGDALGRDGEPVGRAALEGAHRRAEALGGARERLVAWVLDEHLVAGREHRGVREEHGVRRSQRRHHLARRDIVVDCKRLAEAPRTPPDRRGPARGRRARSTTRPGCRSTRDRAATFP